MGGLIGAFTLLVVNWILAHYRTRIPWLQRIAEGEPVLLISGGQILRQRLRQENIDIQELEQAARERGVADLSQVDTAVLEVDGTVSIIPVSDTKVRTKKGIRKI